MRKSIGSRVLAACLSVSMMLTSVPGNAITAFAEEEAFLGEEEFWEDELLDEQEEIDEFEEEDALFQDADEGVDLEELENGDLFAGDEEEDLLEEEILEDELLEDELLEDGLLEDGLMEDEVASSLMSLEDGSEAPSLAQYVTALSIKKGDEAVTSDTALYDGDALRVDFNWTIPGDVYKEHKTYTYQLPVTFKTAQNVSGPVMNGADRAGTYTVGSDGRTVTITYNDTYNTQNNTIVNNMTISGEADYVPNPTEDEIKFLYKDGEQTLVVLNQGDFTVEKKAVRGYENGKFSQESWIDYEVKVSSTLGTHGSFTITDAVAARGIVDSNNKATGESLFDLVALDENSFEIVDQNDLLVTGWNLDAQDQSFTITDLPELQAEGSYTLRYKVNVSERDGVNLADIIKNKVTVSNQEHTHSDDASVTYRSKIYKKSGSITFLVGLTQPRYRFHRRPPALT